MVVGSLRKLLQTLLKPPSLSSVSTISWMLQSCKLMLLTVSQLVIFRKEKRCVQSFIVHGPERRWLRTDRLCSGLVNQRWWIQLGEGQRSIYAWRYQPYSQERSTCGSSWASRRWQGTFFFFVIWSIFRHRCRRACYLQSLVIWIEEKVQCTSRVRSLMRHKIPGKVFMLLLPRTCVSNLKHSTQDHVSHNSRKHSVLTWIWWNIL